MKLSTIPKDFIINASSESGGKVISNFLLHALKIENDCDESIILKSICLELIASGEPVKQVIFQDKSLLNTIKEFAVKATWLDKGFGAKLFLGEEGFFNPELYADSMELKPGQQTGIWNEYFIEVYERVLEELIISVNYIENSVDHKEQLTVPLIQYKNKNEYIFPLKGTISTCGNYNSLPEHRQHYSMEFAFDMAQYNEEQKLCFKENMMEEDYIVYGKDVLAIADGEIVDSYHSFAVTTSWDWEKRWPYIQKYGLAAQCGNYIVIRHANEEYSFYGHLIMDSLTVKNGDRVKQGQTIAKVGHTGLSGCPHLHFQLMNGPDFMAARGLPCSFINIKDAAGRKLGLIQEENIIVHAE
ncbi:MAG: M23 family metallopeptidase [Bacillota bacterium]|nr:M23 family metallopeptidase [Bacillota bacterium]